MLDTLITSKTRIKLMLKFFLNSNSSSYLRSLESEFGESTNAIRIELNRFEEAGLLASYLQSNKKYFKANTKHPLFQEIHSIVKKYIGIDQIISSVVSKIGDINEVYLTGDFASGKNSQIIDLLIVSENLDKGYLVKLVDKAESIISRKIRYLVMNKSDIIPYKKHLNSSGYLLIWKAEDNSDK
jgi:hypothetical protein